MPVSTPCVIFIGGRESVRCSWIREEEASTMIDITPEFNSIKDIHQHHIPSHSRTRASRPVLPLPSALPRPAPCPGSTRIAWP
jgi:hypothetical protein